jgi:hypothetical protein
LPPTGAASPTLARRSTPPTTEASCHPGHAGPSGRYANAADGDAYHAGHLYASKRTTATTATKEAALVIATRLNDAYVTFRSLKRVSAQALRWPRYGCSNPETGGEFASTAIPSDIIMATCELARELITADRTAAPVGEGIAKIWLSSTGTTYDKSDRRPVITRHVVQMLHRLGGVEEERSGSDRLIRS